MTNPVTPLPDDAVTACSSPPQLSCLSSSLSITLPRYCCSLLTGFLTPVCLSLISSLCCCQNKLSGMYIWFCHVSVENPAIVSHHLRVKLKFCVVAYKVLQNGALICLPAPFSAFCQTLLPFTHCFGSGPPSEIHPLSTLEPLLTHSSQYILPPPFCMAHPDWSFRAQLSHHLLLDALIDLPKLG